MATASSSFHVVSARLSTLRLVSIWAPVVAALGSSVLTGAFGFGAIWWQQRRRDKAAALSERSETYHQLIAHSLSFVIRARTLRNAIKARSGLREGLDVTLGINRPLDPFEFHDWFAQGFEPINQTWSKIEMIGSPQAVEAATQVLDACADTVALATQPGAGRGKIATTVGGVQWTAEQELALEAVAERVLNHRRDFIRLARAELGMPVVSPGLDPALRSVPVEGPRDATEIEKPGQRIREPGSG